MATTPWVAGLYADLFYYKNTDARATFQQLEDEQTRSTVVPVPPRQEWDEALRWQLSRDVRLSVATLEQDTGLLPILPRPAWDEVDWQRGFGSRYQSQTQEEDTGLLPVIPTRAWDEVDWQKWTETRLQQSTTEQDSGLLPILPSPAWDDWDWSKSFEPRVSQQDADPWHVFFAIPQAPPTLGWDDWDWSRDYSLPYVRPFDAEPLDFARPIVTLLAYDENDWPRRFDWLYGPQTTEQDLPSLPPAAPSAFEDGEGSRDFTEKHFWLESDVLLGVPFVPVGGWFEESAIGFPAIPGSLAALVVMDDFVDAPSGSGSFGNAPRGRTARFGFSISTFR
jgi:hypothetical protein